MREITQMCTETTTDRQQETPWTLAVAPRAWQTTALLSWEKDFRGVVSVVTGGGKTVFAQMCIDSFRKRFPQGTTLIVAPTFALADQWTVSLEEDLRVPSSEITLFSGGKKPKKLTAVNIFVINTARNMLDFLRDQPDSFLIVDECHRAGSVSNARALAGSHKATLGLSATPEREYDSGFQTTVAPFLGPIIFSYSYQDAFADGVITPFDLVNIKGNMLPHELDQYEQLSRKIAREHARIQKGDGSDETLKRLLQKRATVSAMATMRIPLAAALVEKHRGKRTLVFFENMNAAAALLNILVQRGHRATIYNTSIAPIIRQDNLRLYRRGVFDVLVSCRALDEGTNVPETSVAIIASSTASGRQRIQRLGRVLRPASGKDKAIVLTIYMTDTEERRLKEESKRLASIAHTDWYKAGALQHG